MIIFLIIYSLKIVKISIINILYNYQGLLFMNRSSIGEEQLVELPSYKIIILGEGAAGKTKLLYRYIYGSYSDVGNQTAMVDCTFMKRFQAKYAYYDTAGQQKYRSILNMYFKGSDAALLIYSVDNVNSFL